tara:strand:+ start:394 stop:651 length:258 start_codon:yes stop_codon:yes gene_type:complete
MGTKNVLDAFVEAYKPTAIFRQKVYKLVGGDDALTKYTDEDILVMLESMVGKLKYLDMKDEAESLVAEDKKSKRDSTRWALENCS